MYMFTWTIVSESSNSFLANMYMDDNVIASCLPNGSNSNSGSSTVVIQCDSGSRIYIACRPEGGGCQTKATQNGLGDTHSFTGFLLAGDV